MGMDLSSTMESVITCHEICWCKEKKRSHMWNPCYVMFKNFNFSKFKTVYNIPNKSASVKRVAPHGPNLNTGAPSLLQTGQNSSLYWDDFLRKWGGQCRTLADFGHVSIPRRAKSHTFCTRESGLNSIHKEWIPRPTYLLLATIRSRVFWHPACCPGM
jgi:hypothetical protein